MAGKLIASTPLHFVFMYRKPTR